MLKQLYKSRYLNTTSENHKKVTKQFWNTFQDNLDINIRGIDGKRRILLIIVDKIPYKIIKKKLLIKSDIKLVIEGIHRTSVAYLELEGTKDKTSVKSFREAESDVSLM
ncbi:6359_t:CDS:2 [Scutellospora calospora]|uniref:6359_t:CDS:1 n=1 Tax=Scutellospora calospora TaxID=85575 RepID=A0ACA9JWD4_9GLOM|nr:6359_t:CDS:2 [Scutellospora calospora]